MAIEEKNKEINMEKIFRQRTKRNLQGKMKPVCHRIHHQKPPMFCQKVKGLGFHFFPFGLMFLLPGEMNNTANQ